VVSFTKRFRLETRAEQVHRHRTVATLLSPFFYVPLPLV
jgi:hypothetical protein